jgi:DNA-binding IclR family transcriptional regulator
LEKKRKELAAPLVKSAARVLELVEFLAVMEDGATLMDIARGLDFPQSSTTALLKTLKALGYVAYRRRGRVYYLTARSAMLGARAGAQIFGDGQLFSMMEELGKATGTLVLLAIRNDVSVRLIQAVAGETPIELPSLRQRGIRSLINSASGRLFLSTLSTSEMRSIVRRLNAETADRARRVDLSVLEPELELIRRQGYAISSETTVPGVAGLAVLVPTKRTQDLVAVILAAPAERIRAEQHAYLEILDRQPV